MFSCYVSYHLFGFILDPVLCGIFVEFQFLETLKIVLPSRRNANFHKIDVFALSPKIDKNNPSKVRPKII